RERNGTEMASGSRLTRCAARVRGSASLLRQTVCHARRKPGSDRPIPGGVEMGDLRERNALLGDAFGVDTLQLVGGGLFEPGAGGLEVFDIEVEGREGGVGGQGFDAGGIGVGGVAALVAAVCCAGDVEEVF